MSVAGTLQSRVLMPPFLFLSGSKGDGNWRKQAGCCSIAKRKISNMPSQPHQLGKQLFIPASSHEVLIGGGVMKNSPFAAVFASPWSYIVEFTIAVDHSRVFPGLFK